MLSKVLFLFLLLILESFVAVLCLKCEFEWTQRGSSCYLLQGDLSDSAPLFTFTEAEADCVQRKGHLVSVHSKVEQDFLTDLVKRKESGDCAKENVWTGLWYDEAKEKALLLVNGSPVDFWRNKVDDSFGASALVIQNSLKCSPVAPIFIQIDISAKLSRYICKKTAINEIQDY
ncbi:unnamed protein product, partial [Mesorhabditis belari]|uniref:C-type lectin domain-containing protein n=1 Tax=Mesorhabditis belari TaxID=2138241 RepID=A0AAF3F879_9BILA